MDKQEFADFLKKYSDTDFMKYNPVFIRKPLIIDEQKEDFDRTIYNILEIADINEFPQEFDINYVNQEDLYSISDEVYQEPELVEGKEKSESIELDVEDNKKYIRIIEKLKKKFPKYEKFIDSAKSSGRDIAYRLNTRYDFLKFITTINKKYNKVDSFDMDCKTMKERKFALMNHQILVRNYINLQTPYRGLLVYHGLGAGKTCSAISVAEGIKSMNSGIKKQICVLMPASLQKNFREEIKLCGDPIYDKNMYQTKIEIDKTDNVLLKVFMNILGLSKDYIFSKKGGKERGKIWIPVKKKGEIQLNEQDNTEIENQINVMINNKYDFINYNGNLRKKIGERKEKNLFDHKLVIIDEVHNFISMIFNKMNNFGDHKDELGVENSYILYKKLLSAKNCRVIFLTGTPIINKPVELGLLFNMLRGNIREYTFNLIFKKDKKLTKEMFKEQLIKGNIDNTINYFKYENGKLKITRTPFGFIVEKYDSKGSPLKVVKKQKQYKNEDDFIVNIMKQIKRCFGKFLTKKRPILINKKKDIVEHQALPDNVNDFNRLFLSIDDDDASVKNGTYFQKRINGLVSYYESPSVQLMPKINIFSDYNKDTSYPDITNMKIEEIEMSDYQFIQYIDQRKLERAERKSAGKKNIYEKSNSTYKVYSRMFCNFVFPEKILQLNKKNRRPRPKDQKNIVQDGFFKEEYTIEETKYLKRGIGTTDKDDHIKMLREMINALKINRHGELDIDGNKTNIDYLDDENLENYSPKFLKAYKNILDENNDGANLVYSSFRNVEGIEIFGRGLESRGFNIFKIEKEKSETGGIGRTMSWVLSKKTKDKLEEIKNGDTFLEREPFYMIYSGTESEEKKELLRLIFNGNWGKIQSNASEIKKYLLDNFSDYIDKTKMDSYGKFIKLFMISSSGAEGISLKNTRYVHILEPYWGPVRIDQVIGRARRICSHDGLIKEKQDVSVYLYLMKLTNEQKNWEQDTKIKEIVDFDNKKTSDQSMWELSQKKKNINEKFLKLIKATAIDCITNGGEQCKIYVSNSKNYIYGEPKITKNVDIDEHEKINQKSVKKKRIYIDRKRKIFFVIKAVDKDKAKKDGKINWDFAVGKLAYDKNKGEEPIGRITKNDQGEYGYEKV